MIFRRSLVAARVRSHLSLRALAARSGTSHSAVAAYESGRVSPTFATAERILAATGMVADVSLTHRVADPERGRELAEVLELAAAFPARHDPVLRFPPLASAPVLADPERR